MKNKFSTIKNKKGGELNSSNNNTASSKIFSSKVNNASRMNDNSNNEKDCKRCDELIHILKHTTKYIAR